MKDIKSMIIGFLLATCMFLFMGQTSNDSKVGRYQSTSVYNPNQLDRKNNVYTIIIDTRTGKIVESYSQNKRDFMPYTDKK